MAEIVTLRCDMTGEVGQSVERRYFTWDGVEYEIDADADAWAPWDESMRALIEYARPAEHRTRRAAAWERDPEIPKARAWAKANGIEVPSNGKFPPEVVAAWRNNRPSDVADRFVGGEGIPDTPRDRGVMPDGAEPPGYQRDTLDAPERVVGRDPAPRPSMTAIRGGQR